MPEAALEGSFKALYVQGEDPAQLDPNTQHVTAGLAAMECAIVQDLFLNETAKYAHVFFPRTSFLEKDGTFTNAERRTQRVRKAHAPRGRDWRIGKSRCASRKALGYQMDYGHPVRDHGRDRAADARRSPVCSFEKLAELGSIQWPCNDQAPPRRHAHDARRPLRARQGHVSSSPSSC